jgi:predicted molibdopterin-dependent oxidoreductase YjgC
MMWTVNCSGRSIGRRDQSCRRSLSQVCYLPQLGPIQTCDTCIVEVNGEAGSRLRVNGSRPG